VSASLVSLLNIAVTEFPFLEILAALGSTGSQFSYLIHVWVIPDMATIN